MRSFLTAAEEAVFGQFTGSPEQAVLERFFFLDDADRELVAIRRGDHNRAGFALQLVTVRHLGRFLEDPLDVPNVVLDYVAAQIGVADPSCVKAYMEREKTRFEHRDEIYEVYGYFGLNTATFRCGTLTGPAHAAAELHGFLAYLMRCAMEHRTYRIFGYQGKQVRDAIHSHDLVAAFEAFFRAPRQGEIYNMGGGRHSHTSLAEAVALAEKITGEPMATEYHEANRIGAHIWWVGSTAKFSAHYPAWAYTYDVEAILTEMYETNRDTWVS
jgi:hypothetical protein